MNVNFLQTRYTAPAGTAIGAGVGGAVGGPAGAIVGAKIGAAVGAQIGLGGRVDKAADGTLSALELGLRSVEKIAKAWGALCLIGYGISIALTGTSTSMENFTRFCSGPMQSINCYAMSLTNISANMMAISTMVAFLNELRKLTLGKDDNISHIQQTDTWKKI